MFNKGYIICKSYPFILTLKYTDFRYMAGKKTNKGEDRSTEKELLEKPKEVLVKYIMRLEDEWFKFDTENGKLKKKILELEKMNKKHEVIIHDKQYNKKMKWIDKLIFIIELNKGEISVQEIKNKLIILEPEVKLQWADIDNRISQLLHKAFLDKILSRKKINDGNRYLYNLPSS